MTAMLGLICDHLLHPCELSPPTMSLSQMQSENEEIKEHIMSELESIARLRVEEGEERKMDEQH